MLPTPPNAEKPNSAKSLWVPVGLLFGLMAVAWFFLFSLATDNPIDTVPLEHRQP